MSRNRDEGAMRIMEALSDVDEELLERSERVTGSLRKPLWQRTKAWAAILCLAVAGGIAWSGFYLERVSDGGNSMNSSGMMSGGAANGNQFSTGGGAAMIPSSDGVSAEEAPPFPESEMGDGMNVESTANTGNGLVSGGASQIASITEGEARDLKGLGNYVPRALPEGYVFGYAYSGMEGGIPGEAPEWLEITWTRGEDRIVLYVEEESFCDTVDVGNPETYDVRLYRKPYIETVPEAYRAVFENPVFALEDFDEEIVKSRMMPVEEGGKNTGICEGNFGVLYTDNVLVRFSGIGTAEEIWEMFYSIGE